MRILVDEMPKEAEECIFVNEAVIAALGEIDVKVCIFSGNLCDVKTCHYLKEFNPIKDDCK